MEGVVFPRRPRMSMFPAQSVWITLAMLGKERQNNIKKTGFASKKGIHVDLVSTKAHRFQVGSDQPHWSTSVGFDVRVKRLLKEETS